MRVQIIGEYVWYQIKNVDDQTGGTNQQETFFFFFCLMCYQWGLHLTSLQTRTRLEARLEAVILWKYGGSDNFLDL